MRDVVDFIHGLSWSELPDAVHERARLCLMDLLGVAAGGLGTQLSRISRDHAALDHAGPVPILFDDRSSSLPGAALVAGQTIDALDGHDGFNPSKGHVGCPLLPALLAFSYDREMTGRAFLEALAMGYEFGSRAATAQHATVPDYHTSGSWGAVTAAAAGARVWGLNRETTRHALGIAEYHGPRSQMMRCIDFPTMLKDGSGWGAMTGVSAVQLAARGFTGAPAVTIEDAQEHWRDLGTNWLILQQYFKPWPVCRWAQAPVAAVLDLRARHDLTSDQVAQIAVSSFHEATRLATATPRTTEEAQYSTSFPCAVALARGRLGPEDLDGAALQDPEILRLSQGLTMTEDDTANAAFPEKRFARVTLTLRDGQVLESDWFEPPWDADRPPTAEELTAKYHTLTDPVLGAARATALRDVIETLEDRPLSDLTALLYRPA